jgi:hypothetical protein
MRIRILWLVAVCGYGYFASSCIAETDTVCGYKQVAPQSDFAMGVWVGTKWPLAADWQVGRS